MRRAAAPVGCVKSPVMTSPSPRVKEPSESSRRPLSGSIFSSISTRLGPWQLVKKKKRDGTKYKDSRKGAGNRKNKLFGPSPPFRKRNEARAAPGAAAWHCLSDCGRGATLSGRPDPLSSRCSRALSLSGTGTGACLVSCRRERVSHLGTFTRVTDPPVPLQ